MKEPTMKEENSISTSTLLLAFAGGAALGAGLALLFAPQSGSKTRRQLGGLADDAEAYAREMAEEAAQGIQKARKKGEHWVEEAKDFVEEKKAQVAAAMDGGRR
jgi:gas vesicle protein